MTDDLFADPAARARVLSRIPSGKLGEPRDVGALAVFLLSNAASYITGQLFNVDGGWLAS
jgi:NAD(P)-dependent dehydrogenase (short-subunit alcohol dehydrogenase family)